MRWRDIASLTSSDLQSIPTADLRKYAAQLNSVANHRIDRFKRRGEETPATIRAEEGGRFTIRGKQSREEVIEEMARAKRFLYSQTSTAKGYQTVKERAAKDVEDVTGAEVPPGFDWGAYWRVMEHAMEHKTYIESNRLRRKVIELMTDNPALSVEELMERIDVWAESEYRKRVRRNRPNTSDFTRVARRKSRGNA